MDDCLNELKEKKEKKRKEENTRKRAKYVRQGFRLIDGLKLGNKNDEKKLKKVRSSVSSASV